MTTLNLVPIIPKGALFDEKNLRRVMDNTLTALAKDIKVDFDVTAQTWSNKPTFGIALAGRNGRVISTNHEIYGYINYGTRVRYATMTPGFRPKTSPGLIASRAGSGRVMYVRKDRPRPGIQARRFDLAIAKKWQKLLPNVLERAILSELQ